MRSCDYDPYFAQRMAAVRRGLMSLRPGNGLKVCQGAPMCPVDEAQRQWWKHLEACTYCDRYFMCRNGIITLIKGKDIRELGN